MSKAILSCPNCDRSWSTRDCAARNTIICECGFGLAVPDTRSKAIAAASCASEAANELLNFAREGHQLGDTAFSVSVGEKLADAFRLSIEAQGGPDDADEALLYTRLCDYLDPGHLVREPAQYEARAFTIPDGRWYICRVAASDLDEEQRFLSEPEAQGICAMLNLAAPAGAGRTPLPTQDEMRLAHAIVDSNPVLGVYAAPEWHSLTEDAQQWAAVLIREAKALAQKQADTRTMFEAGFLACWSEAFVKGGKRAPFELTDAALDRAWEIHVATRESKGADVDG